MKNYPVFILIFILYTFSSCVIAGLTSGYSHLTKGEQSRIVKCEGAISDISNTSNIYTVRSGQVQEYLSTHDKVIVYDYTPFCHSQYCVSPQFLLDLCEKKGLNLLIISNIYDDIFTAKKKDNLMLMIDTKSCKSKWRSKYIDDFYLPLIHCKSKDVGYASYFYFDKGNYVRSFKDVKDIENYSF